MSVQKVTQIFETEATLNDSARKEFEVTFTDNSEDNVLAAATATDGTTTIPALNAQFSASYTNYVAQRPIVKRIGRAPLYRVIVPYAVNDAGSGGNKAISPLDRPVEWSSDGVDSTQDVDTTAAGALILTSAGQVIVTQVMHSDVYFKAVKNLATMTDYMAYFCKTNSANFTVDPDGMAKVFGPETLFLRKVTQEFVEEEYAGEVVQYWRATFVFYGKINRDTGAPEKWTSRIMDQGTVKLDANGDQAQITDPLANVVVSEPVKLNGAGDVLNPASSPFYLEGAGFSQAPTAFTTVYQTAAFAGLGL